MIDEIKFTCDDCEKEFTYPIVHKLYGKTLCEKCLLKAKIKTLQQQIKEERQLMNITHKKYINVWKSRIKDFEKQLNNF